MESRTVTVRIVYLRDTAVPVNHDDALPLSGGGAQFANSQVHEQSCQLGLDRTQPSRSTRRRRVGGYNTWMASLILAQDKRWRRA